MEPSKLPNLRSMSQALWASICPGIGGREVGRSVSCWCGFDQPGLSAATEKVKHKQSQALTERIGPAPAKGERGRLPSCFSFPACPVSSARNSLLTFHLYLRCISGLSIETQQGPAEFRSLKLPKCVGT